MSTIHTRVKFFFFFSILGHSRASRDQIQAIVATYAAARSLTGPAPKTLLVPFAPQEELWVNYFKHETTVHPVLCRDEFPENSIPDYLAREKKYFVLYAFYFPLFSFFSSLLSSEIPGPGIAPVPRQQPEPLQRLRWILNLLSHREHLSFLF